MGRDKIKKNWMIGLVFIGGIIYGINVLDALFYSKREHYEYLGMDVNKWVYIGMMAIFSISLIALSTSWYKQKKHAKNDN